MRRINSPLRDNLQKLCRGNLIKLSRGEFIRRAVSDTRSDIMLQIRIDQQYAKIGLDIKKPFLALQTTPPQIELDIQEPEIEIHSPRPRLHIDQRECFADMDKRTPEVFSRYWTGIAINKAFEAVGTISSEGDSLGQIERGITIENLAQYVMDNMVDFNVTAIPKQPPKIEADVRPVEFNLRRGTVDSRLNRGQVEHNFEWGKVNAYLRQKNYLNITWEESKISKMA